MKKALLFIPALIAALCGSGQLANGTLAPNFVITDIEGNTHELYDYLGQGYSVVLDISATWCGPCWGYHLSGALETLHQQHGVENGGNVIVIFVEGDAQTTHQDLLGTGSDTQGDWVTGENYIISEDAWMSNLFQIDGFPSVFTICPTGKVTYTGMKTASQHWAFINTNSCQNVPSNDATLPAYEGAREFCAGEDLDVSVNLLNVGTENLTSAVLTATGVNPPLTYNWSGNLAPFESATVELGSSTLVSPVSVSITSSDAVSSNNTIAGTTLAAESTTQIRFDIKFDAWPQECSWEILNDNDAVVYSGGPYTNQADYSTLIFDRFLPSEGCYRVIAKDQYGDGLHGSIWGGSNQDGHFYVYSMENGVPQDNILYNPGNLFYQELEEFANVSEVVSVEETTHSGSIALYPNPASDIVTLAYNLPVSGEVSFDIVSLLGERVKSQYIGNREVGKYTVPVDVSELATGLYLVNFYTNGAVHTMRLTVTK